PVGPSQHPELNEEFDIGDAARILLEIDLTGFRFGQILSHARAHVANRLFEAIPLDRLAQHLNSRGFELRAQSLVAGDCPRAKQRLVLPRPCFLELVVPESGERLYEYAA